MKNILCLVASLALAPLAARAQSNPYAPSQQTQQNQAADEAYRQRVLNDYHITEAQKQQNNSNSTGGTGGGRGPLFRKPRYGQMLTGKTAEERKRNRAYKADKKAHNGWKSYPGGYRGKDVQIMKPDGTVVGAETPPPAPKQPAAPSPRPIDPQNSLGKLQEYNRQQAAKEKAAAQPVR